jgi:hypothetical protein
MHLEDLFAADDVRAVDRDLPVEAAGPQQRLATHAPTSGKTLGQNQR